MEVYSFLNTAGGCKMGSTSFKTPQNDTKIVKIGLVWMALGDRSLQNEWAPGRK